MAAPHLPSPERRAKYGAVWRRVLQISAVIIGGCGLTIMVLYAGLLAYSVLWLFGILDAEWSRDEVARVASPSGRVEAVLYETNGGATTSFGYEVWVVQLGASVSRSQAERHPTPAYLYGAGRSSRAYGVNLRWEGPGTLVVEYLKARDVTQNVPEVRVGDQTVWVVLRPGVNDSSAPPGGMLYNRGLAAHASNTRSAPLLPGGK